MQYHSSVGSARQAGRTIQCPDNSLISHIVCSSSGYTSWNATHCTRPFIFTIPPQLNHIPLPIGFPLFQAYTDRHTGHWIGRYLPKGLTWSWLHSNMFAEVGVRWTTPVFVWVSGAVRSCSNAGGLQWITMFRTYWSIAGTTEEGSRQLAVNAKTSLML